jgi:hypothetical protein
MRWLGDPPIAAGDPTSELVADRAALELAWQEVQALNSGTGEPCDC